MSRRFGALVFARMGSSRLRGKTLREVMPGWTLLDMVVARAAKASSLQMVGVATGDTPLNDAVEEHCRRKGYPCFRGSEQDVQGRGLAAAKSFGLDDVLWLTGDNPFIDHKLIDSAHALYREGGYDYVASTHMGHTENWEAERTFPRGITIQIMSRDVLERADPLATNPVDRENGTFPIYDNPQLFKLGAQEASGPFAAWRHPELRMTIDTEDDWTLLVEVVKRLNIDNPADFDTGAAIALIAADPKLAAINCGVKHNIASEMRQGA